MGDEEGAQKYPCANADESRTHIVGECGLYKKGRKVLGEDMMKVDRCDMEEFGGSEKMIFVLGDT